PNYISEGIEPAQLQVSKLGGNAIAVARPKPLPLDNPRAKRPIIRQPYATSAPSPVGRGSLPNVGNNVEQSWSSVDEQIVDDLSEPIDPNRPMIDNNEIMTEQSMGYQSGFDATTLQQSPVMSGTVVIDRVAQSPQKDNTGDNLFLVVSDLQADSFLLIVQGVPICSGPLLEIEEQVETMV